MSLPHRNANQENISADDRTFFVTTNTWERRQLFRTERLARMLIDTLYHYRRESKYRLHEFVVMPDHLHVLITIGREISIEKAVQLIKGGFSYRVKRELGAATEIWQRGFSDRRIRGSEEYITRVEYIRNNPVRARLCDAPEGYPYSSAAAGFEVDPPPAAKAELSMIP